MLMDNRLEVFKFVVIDLPIADIAGHPLVEELVVVQQLVARLCVVRETFLVDLLAFGVFAAGFVAPRPANVHQRHLDANLAVVHEFENVVRFHRVVCVLQPHFDVPWTDDRTDR